MKVLVTGAAGFLGSHVVDALMGEHAVSGVDDLSTGRAEWCACPLEEARFWEVSTRGADAIVHCAATADISQNWLPNNNRLDIYDDNIFGVHQLLEALTWGTTVKRFIFISTAAVESAQQSPYTASKIAGEAMCRAYCQAINIDLTIVRPVSMLGKRYHHGHVMDFVRMAMRDGVIRAKDNGHQRKPYCHVQSVTALIHSALVNGSDGMVRVPGYPWGVAWTAEMIGVPIEWSKDERGWTGDPDIHRAYWAAGEASPWIRETIDWCKADLCTSP